ncbi:erythroblast NAD(P)(+)--arginine ADP-ribosyltransferase-like protein [Labeo rohita]|uniref:NAD(P)(+)--arginine ADP-ribosyltransferase n=1 Tax=Labeo rohita TaxID=84645 RepID=A0A498N1G0_LABRO|nr:erythroblast NAD(P)(+)--arginine ADP-ribosyltransferase-like protein [Labeo rohita]
MLLVIEALILISAALGQDNRTADTDERQIIPLDMAENSVDDKFYWCTKKMEYRVQTEFLRKELLNTDFAKAWETAEQKHKTPEDNLSKNHSVAIYVYTDTKTYTTFNDAVRNGKQNYKDETYAWYSLHFWLTEAIQILKKKQTKCFNTYRGTKDEYDKNVKKGKEIRFGSFTSSSLDREKAADFGSKTCFEIRTCQGADLTKYSKFCDEKEVLIPPYETFKVTAVKTRTDQKDLWCETVFTLKNYKKRSFLNCAVAHNSGNQVVFLNALLILTLLCYVLNY